MLSKGKIDNSKEMRASFQTHSHLREIREARGMSQVQLAGIIATSPQIISKAEHGRILQIRTSMLIRIANALDLGVADLWPIFAARVIRKKQKHVSQLNPMQPGMVGTHTPTY